MSAALKFLLLWAVYVHDDVMKVLNMFRYISNGPSLLPLLSEESVTTAVSDLSWIGTKGIEIRTLHFHTTSWYVSVKMYVHMDYYFHL